MKDSNKLKQQRKEYLDKSQAILDLTKAEKRDMTPEEKTEFDSFVAQCRDLAPRIEHAERSEALEVEQAKAALSGAKTSVEARVEIVESSMPGLRGSKEYRSAFLNFLRRGEIGISTEERILLEREVRTLGTAPGSSGGYLVPEGFAGRIESALLAFGGMREASTILQTSSGNDLPFPTNDDTSNVGEILSENPAAEEASDTLTFGSVVYKAYEFSSKPVPASVQLLEDSGVDLEAYLSARLAERIARIQNTYFTTGDDANKPRGFALDSSSAGTTASATAVTYDELVTLVHGLDPAYRSMGARFMFNDSTLAAIMKLKDSNGHYYFQPDSTGAESKSILGYPYTVNQDCASIQANAKAVFFGLFSKYQIRDVRGISVLRDPITQQRKRQVVFIAFQRSDGRLLDAGTRPIKHLLQHA